MAEIYLSNGDENYYDYVNIYLPEILVDFWKYYKSRRRKRKN